MSILLQDLRYATRSLFRQPAFALAALLTLALGIGAATAMFSVVNAVILRPLPFDEPDRIVAVMNRSATTGRLSQNVSGPDFADWKVQNRSFASFAHYWGGQTSVTVNGAAGYINVHRVTGEFFEVLRVGAAHGRLFTGEERAGDGPRAVVITDAFWRQYFGGAAAAIGTPLKFSNQLHTIVGVLPPGVRYPISAEVLAPGPEILSSMQRGGHNYQAIARLKDEVTLAQAADDMAAIAARLEREHPGPNRGKQAAVVPLKDRLVPTSTRTMLYVLLGAVGLVLLIACANVANLLLSRSSVRGREMVVRAAVGASRGRLVRQLLTESTLLAVIAGVSGAWFARLSIATLIGLAPADLPRLDDVRVDVTALMFTLAIALGASLIFGLAPALQTSRAGLAEGLRQGGKGTSVGARGGWARNAFVVAEIALAIVLVVGASVFARSLAALAAVDMGFDPERLLVLRTSVPIASRQEAPRATAFYRDVLVELRAVPGVEAVSGVTSLPTIVRSNGSYAIEGGPAFGQPGVTFPSALFNVVTPDYFRTLRVPVKVGRDFSESDRLDAPFVAIINESLARLSFPDQNPIGRRLRCGLDSPEFMTIVGVVADVKTSGPTEAAQPELFMPYEQHPGPAASLNIVARTRMPDPLSVAETMRRTIGTRNQDVPVTVTTMNGTLETATAAPRFRTYLMTVFGGIALMLALAGVYGVMAYTVSQRVPELGVRIALGATPRSILGLILGHGARLAAAGIVVGVALALVSGRALRGLLFEVTPWDPITLGVVVTAVTLATLAACYIPGRRAVSVNPMVALRGE
jgi:putative ABC transport system permease protein